MLRTFLVLTSRSFNSCSFQSNSLTDVVNTGRANVLYAVTLFREYSSDSQIFLILRKNSFFIFSLFRGPSKPMSSSTPRYLYMSSSSDSLISIPLMSFFFPSDFLFPLLIYMYAHLASPNVIPISLENFLTISSSNFKLLIDVAYSFKSSTKSYIFIVALGISLFLSALKAV